MTDRELKALKCPSGRKYLEQAIPGLSGFRVRVFPTGAKSFSLMYRFGGRKQRIKVGAFIPGSFGLSEARSKAKDILALVQQGKDPAGELAEQRRHSMTVRELYELFEAEAVRALSTKTQANWKGTSRRFLADLGSLRIADTETIAERVMALHDRVGKDGSPSLAKRIFGHVGQMFKWARSKFLLRADQYPLTGLRCRFRDEKKTNYYHPGEIRALLAATRTTSLPDRSFFMLLWLTGARRGRVASMKWTDIREDHTTPGQWLWYMPKGKNGDPVSVPLCSQAWAILSELRSAGPGSEYVFPKQRADGTSGHRCDSNKPVERIARVSGVEDFACHDIRRTIATHMIEALEVPSDVVTAILNHRLPGPGANAHYIFSLPLSRMRDALERWSQHLDRIAAQGQEQAVA